MCDFSIGGIDDMNPTTQAALIRSSIAVRCSTMRRSSKLTTPEQLTPARTRALAIVDSWARRF